MKHKIAVAALVLALFMGGGMADLERKAHADTAFSFGLFYNSLGAYGSWVPISGYGYGWYPAGVGPGWQPYLDGQWVWTDQGWTWVSNEPWGWATYHYGRWIYDGYYGWIWIPGTVWAPAYVSWYRSPGYYGWSPLPPDNNFFIEIGISFIDYDYGYYGPYYGGYYGGYHGYKHKKHKKGHYYDNDYYAPGKHCVFVPEDKFTNKNAKLVAVNGDHNTTVIRNVKNITNIKVENNKIYNYGPEKSSIERATKGKIAPVKLVDSDLTTVRAGKNGNSMDRNDYKVFRPSIERKAGETPYNSQGLGGKNIWTTRDNEDTDRIKNSLTVSDTEKGNSFVQKRNENTVNGKPYGNVAPDDYGVINKDKGRLESGTASYSRKREQSTWDEFIPSDKPAYNEKKPSTVANRKNNTYDGPSMFDKQINQSRKNSNTVVNDRLKQNQAPAREQQPVYRTPYNYQQNNYKQKTDRVKNQHTNPVNRQSYQKQSYQRAPEQPRTNYNPYRYNAQNQQPQYRQSQQKQSKPSYNRKSSGSNENSYRNSSPRQYSSPTRNFGPGNTRPYNGSSSINRFGKR